MVRKIYQKPEVEVIVTQYLMGDNYPMSPCENGEEDIFAKENNFMLFDEDEEGWQHSSPWDK